MSKSQPKFLKVRVKNYIVMHGYDASNKEIEESVRVDSFVDKLIAIDRIQSISEKFILTTYAAGRLIYWEYEGGLKKISVQLKKVTYVV